MVDDDPEVRVVALSFLSKLGYVASEAVNGKAAMEKILNAHKIKSPFDLLILDFGMPVMNGSELFLELGRQGSCPPVIFISGGLTAEQFELTKDDHCLGVLFKPFDREQIRDIVARAFSVMSGHVSRPSSDDLVQANNAGSAVSPSRNDQKKWRWYEN